MHHNTNTSIAGWSFALAQALDDYGIDAPGVFKEAGINLDEVPSAAARLPVSNVQKVWRYAAEHTDDYFGITVSGFLGPASFQGLGFALWSSSSLKDFIERFIRYRCVLSHMFFCDLLEEDDCYRLIMVDERSIKSAITNDTTLSYIVRMARQLGDPNFAPSLVQTTVEKNTVAEKLQDFYCADIEYDSPDHSLL